MLSAREWAAARRLDDKPWLILGKGPTLSKLKNVDTDVYNILALNHVGRSTRADIALMMDLDVFDDVGEDLYRNAAFVFLPWRPHVKFSPSSRTLKDMIADRPLLRKLESEGRLVAFNAETGRNYAPLENEPVTRIKFFSAEAGLNVLADNGAKVIRTLGVDGGASYAPAFSDLNDKTLLANGRPDFNKQFEMFAQTLRRHPGLVFGPLSVQTPVRIFIGADETQILGAKMFEYSVRRHASMSVRFQIIDNEGLPTPADPQKRARTGFSFSRFKIPDLCDYKGRAIYVDADMQVFTDIKDLWTRNFQDSWLLYSTLSGVEGRVPQYSVMLLDCAKLDWNARQLIQDLDSGKYAYKDLMADFAMMPDEKKQPLLEFEWNSLEHYEPGRTKLIHYTDMPTQPWVSDKNKNGQLWYDELRRAVQDGFVSLEEIYEEIERGHISPLLPEWAKLTPHPRGRQLERAWSPPYRRFAVQAKKAAG